MRVGPVLAIETATMVGGVALIAEDGVVAEHLLNVRATYAERILPAVETVLGDAGVSLGELGGIAVSLGPGSFTGLRIGLATAQGLAVPSGLPLVGVGTLAAMAWNLWGCEDMLVPVLDARRGEIYGAVYEYSEGELSELIPPCAQSPAVLAGLLEAEIARRDQARAVLLGPGSGLLAPQLAENLSPRWRRAPLHLSFPRPAAVGDLGRRLIVAGRIPAPESLSPEYLRPPAAKSRSGVVMREAR